jgi:hypothetical protein
MGSFAGGLVAGVVESKKLAREGATVSLISEPLNPTRDTPAMTVSKESHLIHRLIRCSVSGKATLLIEEQSAMQEQHRKDPNK